MKAHYINELAEGSKVDAPFALRAKEMRAARTGQAYLSLELADRTGRMPGVCFRPGPETAEIPVGTVVRVRGTVTSYRGVKRVSIESMIPAVAYQAEDLLAEGPRPREELIDELRGLIGSVSEPSLRKVLRGVFSDKAFFERFCSCPGSQSHHHAYLGGLLEHTVAVAGICAHLAEQYPDVDRDLLVTAAVLHDVGKCDELAYDTGIEYTDRGRLLGHVMLGAARVGEAVARARVSPELASRLEHAVISHHGELEWGSPKRPCTLEAMLLHHADNLDAKAAGFSALLRGAVRAEESWTDAANLFRRPLYAPRAVEDDRPHAADEDAQYSRLSA